MSRIRAADDFEAIRLRLEELRRERAQPYGNGPKGKVPAAERSAAPQRPAPADKRYPPIPRRSGSV